MKNIVIAELHIFAMFALFGYLYKNQLLFTAFGFEEGEKPVLIGLMIILQFITAPYNTVLDFAMTVLSRRFEFQVPKVWIIKYETLLEIETSVTSIIFSQSIWNFVKITISWVLCCWKINLIGSKLWMLYYFQFLRVSKFFFTQTFNTCMSTYSLDLNSI